MSQYTLERTGQLLLQIKDSIVFYAVAAVVLVFSAMQANGFGQGILSVFGSDSYSLPLIARTGCQIDLDKWYIFFTSMILVKLLIEATRYVAVTRWHRESIAVHLGGNFCLMPVLFAVFFVYTQGLYENSNPDPDH